MSWYGSGPIQTRSDNWHGSYYAGCYYWKQVLDAYKAWQRDGSIFRITWWEREGQIVDYDFESVKKEYDKWRHRCYIPVTKSDLAKWSSRSQQDILKVCSWFDRIPGHTQMFVDQDLYNLAPYTEDHHTIHDVLTEEGFLRRYCPEHYHKFMLAKEEKQFEKQQREDAKKAEEASAKVREAARLRREAKERQRAEAEQKQVAGKPEEKADACKKKHRGRRGGRRKKKAVEIVPLTKPFKSILGNYS